MRLWSLHPSYLDRQGLTACWRESLLAQAVLAGTTRGYTHHPQLERFRGAADPLAAVGCYLRGVADEADARGYRFDRRRIRSAGETETLPVTTGQLALEWTHLRAKLAVRDPDRARRWRDVQVPQPHPLFFRVDGPVEPWERARPGD